MYASMPLCRYAATVGAKILKCLSLPKQIAARGLTQDTLVLHSFRPFILQSQTWESHMFGEMFHVFQMSQLGINRCSISMTFYDMSCTKFGFGLPVRTLLKAPSKISGNLKSLRNPFGLIAVSLQRFFRMDLGGAFRQGNQGMKDWNEG